MAHRAYSTIVNKGRALFFSDLLHHDGTILKLDKDENLQETTNYHSYSIFESYQVVLIN